MALAALDAQPKAPAPVEGLREKVAEVLRKMRECEYTEEGPRHPEYYAQLGDVSHYREQVQADLGAALSASNEGGKP